MFTLRNDIKTEGLFLTQRSEYTTVGLNFGISAQERPLEAVRLQSLTTNKIPDFKAEFAISS